MSGFFSLLYALYCLTLPHTPPIPAKETDPIDGRSAVLESLELMRFRSFAVLVLVAGLIGIMLAFYFACENYFLEAIGVDPTQTGSVHDDRSDRRGPGHAAGAAVASRSWVSRRRCSSAPGRGRSGSALSALGYPFWLMISTIALHGFAFGFFFVVAQMYVDRAASKDIKASAQSLLIFVVYGMGTILGSVLTGYVRRFFTEEVQGVKIENWHGTWMGPFLLTLVCMLIFARPLREEEIGDIKAEESGLPGTAPALH